MWKRAVFSVYEKPSDKEKLFQHTKISISHCIKTNVQLQISSAKTYCELAVQQSFFEKHRSCVCTTATLSHRFKASPAIPGKLAMPGAAGYMMNAGHFRESHESSGDLNRGRRTKSRVLFGYFLHNAKSDNPYSLAGNFEASQTSKQCTAATASHRNN